MKVFGEHEKGTLDQLETFDAIAERTALMADGHLGYGMPVGGVAAFRNQVSPAGVGYDIACGNCAMRLDINEPGRRSLYELGKEIRDTICFGVGGQNSHRDAPVAHPIFHDDRWNIVPETVRTKKRTWTRKGLRSKARRQLGTVGSGNHYVDVFRASDGYMWVGVHFGSRGFGYQIATAGLALADGKGWGERGETGTALLSLDTQAGQDYWDLMQLAGEYAYAGREWVCRAVAKMLGAGTLDVVHNNHNFAWRETQIEEEGELVVVRKGATPAYPGQRGFVGGSMGDDAVILGGSAADQEDDSVYREMEAAMFSTVHGAGRVMSRTAATGRNRRGKKKSEPRVDYDSVMEWIKAREVFVFGGDLDESPLAYRRLPDVLAAQGETIEVLHTLRPLLVVMASECPDESDPFLIQP